MKRAIFGSVLLLAISCLPAAGQEGSVPRHRLAQLGLCGMSVLPDAYVDVRHVPPPPQFDLLPAPPVQGVPPVIGMRQMVILESLRAQDQRWLKQYAWRTAHRARGF